MKRYMLMVLLFGGCLLWSAAADTYDERLEFIETSGTQWADTGLKLHFRNSKYRLRVRVLDYATANQVLFAGLTEVKDNPSATGADQSSSSFAVGAKPYGYNGSYTAEKQFVIWNTCSSQGPYGYPSSPNAKYPLERAYTIEGQRHVAWVNGTTLGSTSGYDNRKPDALSKNTYFIGACNNAGDGVLYAKPEGECVRVQWYRAEFWTDGELVGDFIPVKKSGVVGFFDQVTETFHASIGSEAFAAPEYVTWKGGNAADSLAVDANWEGGVAPSKYTQIAKFPAGVAVTNSSVSVTNFLNRLGGIRLGGDDTLFCITNRLASKTQMYCNVPVFGKGTFRIIGFQDGYYPIGLCADNGFFTGLIDIRDLYCYYHNSFALGEYGVGTARYRGDLSNVRLRSDTAITLYADIDLARTGSMVEAYGVTFAGRLRFTTGYGPTIYTTSKVYFACDIEDSSSEARSLSLNGAAGNFYFDNPAKTKNLRRLRIRSVQKNNLYFNGPLVFTRLAKNDSPYGQSNVALDNSYDTGITFGCTNALDDVTFLLMAANKISLKLKRDINLNGYPQRVGILALNVLNDSSQTSFDATTTWNAKYAIRSATPATLTILETFRNDSNDGTAAYCGVYPGCVNGAASIVLAENEIVDPKNWAKKMRFNCPGSDTTGSLTARGGFIEIMPTATFSNLTALAAQKTGVVKVGTADVGNATNLVVSVTDATTAKIEIADGITLKADTAQMGDGHWLEAGKYSSVASEGVKACSYLSGTGVLEVSRYGGKRGCILYLR